MVEQGHVTIERRWGKPIIRPDGLLLDIHINDEWGYVRFGLEEESLMYDNEEVVLLGEGNFDDGIARIGKACFENLGVSEEAKDNGRFFEEEIETARAIGRLGTSYNELDWH